MGYQFKPALELTPRDARARLAAGTLVLVDCRTRAEWDLVRVPGSVHIPLDEVEQRADAVEPAPGQQVAVICHHGVRSIRATLALRALGHPGALSVAGGIDAWSLSADPAIPRYERGPLGSRLI
jgi:adenylyltransferase/sulfurtransferase